jgi:nucleotide-binding universal stress UspA family protein
MARAIRRSGRGCRGARALRRLDRYRSARHRSTRLPLPRRACTDSSVVRWPADADHPLRGASRSTGERVLVAWDGGREASRAVGDALPILARAKDVTITTIHRDEGERIADEAATRRLADYLQSHGIDAKVDHSSVEDISVGEWLLSRSADLGIDLIVMGAYAHTRLRELVLGGVTRTMLQSMTVPVLMSH